MTDWEKRGEPFMGSSFIFLSPGTTSLEIARNIKDKRITIVSNDLLIGYELKDKVGIKVIVTGGDLVQSTSTLVGGFAPQVLNGIHINEVFIGVNGVSFDSGYTLSLGQQKFVENIKALSQNAKILIMDGPTSALT